MIKKFSNNTCAFDCEWVPCVVTGRRLLGLSDDVDDRSVCEALWREYRKDPEGDARPFLKYALSKVVSIAAVVRKADKGKPIHLELYAHDSEEAGEGRLIRDFLEMVAEGKFQLWGFNSSQADVPILIQRAIALGVAIPKFGKRPDKPWNGDDYFDSRNSDAHMDILEIVGGRGGGAQRPSLHELASAAGIPGKLETKGSDVADLYLDARIGDIVEYNETDAVTTHLLMLRIAYVAGELPANDYQREIGAVEQLVREQVELGKPAFMRFDRVWQREPRTELSDPSSTATASRLSRTAGGGNDHAAVVLPPLQWAGILDLVKERRGIQLRAILNAVVSKNVCGDTVYLAFGNNDYSRKKAEESGLEVATIIAEVLGVPEVTLVCRSGV